MIAVFSRRYFAVKKKGVLTISAPAMEMLDVVVMTGITMQYRWEETRQNRRRANAVSAG